ncbi:MAG: biotin/lipoyl-containing protein, partial [Sphaerochaeta sp.]|nr:biotin/lipoyl-containing protein [Sphaerochaeta sp.]
MAIKQITVPHLGDFSDIPIIEVYVKEGDSVAADDSLIALESAKAVTDIPSPYSGTIVKLLVKEGDLVSEGSPIAEIEVAEGEAPPPPEVKQEEPKREAPPATKKEEP